MTTESGQGNTAPGAWHGADHAALVTAKGWKGADDALRSYSELEKFTGAPADRLIKLPEADKIDDAFRTDVFKRIGYTPPTIPGAPEKWEDYGVKTREGVPAEYGTAMMQAAHKAGVTKEQLAALVAANDVYADNHSKTARDAEDKLVNDRIAAADKALSKEDIELMQRAATKAGYDEKTLRAVEETLALIDDKAVSLFRNVLLANGKLGVESPLHRGSTERGMLMTAEQAQTRLTELSRNAEWAAKAMTRGTPEAEENLRLNRIIAGAPVNDEEIRRQAKAVSQP